MNQRPTPAPERLSPGTALDYLREAEWHHPSWDDACPVCEQPKVGQAHTPDCLLALAISALAPVPAAPDALWVGSGE